MLHVIIEHCKDETVYIQAIRNDGNILAEIKEDNSIDLDVCVPYINQEIAVHHIYTDDSSMDYTLTAKLESVEIEPMTHVKCIKYSVVDK